MPKSSIATRTPSGWSTTATRTTQQHFSVEGPKHWSNAVTFRDVAFFDSAPDCQRSNSPLERSSAEEHVILASFKERNHAAYSTTNSVVEWFSWGGRTWNPSDWVEHRTRRFWCSRV